MTLQYLIARRSVDLVPEAGELVATGLRVGAGSAGDRDLVEGALRGSQAVPLPPSEAWAALVTGVIDAYFTSDPDVFLLLAEPPDWAAEYRDGFDFLTFDPARGELRPAAPDQDAPDDHGLPEPDPDVEPTPDPVEPPDDGDAPDTDDPPPDGIPDAADTSHRLFAPESLGLRDSGIDGLDGATVLVIGTPQDAEGVSAQFAELGLSVTVRALEASRSGLREATVAVSRGVADAIVAPADELSLDFMDSIGLVALPDLLGPLSPRLIGTIVDRTGAPFDGNLDAGLIRFLPVTDGEAIEAPLDVAGAFSLAAVAGARGLFVAEAAASATEAINTADALAILRLAVGLPAEPGRETTAADLIAADFLGTGSVTTADALAVLRVAVGLSADAAPRFVFVEPDVAGAAAESRNLPDISVIAGTDPLQLVSILVGDVV